jgi:hypothetical protein
LPVSENDMSTVAATAERPDGQEQPVRPAAGCRIRRRWLPPAIVGGLLALLLTGGLVVTTPPAFYRRVVGLGSDAEALAGRFVTEAAAVVAAVDREGPWGVEMSQHAINAWLGYDLPRNHPELLGRSAWGRLSRPRVEFAPKLARIGIEVTAWGVTAVAWAEVEVSLRAANQFVLTVRRAGLGSLPLPRDAVLRECGNRMAKAGLETDMQRFRDRSLLLVTIPEQLVDRSTGAAEEPRQPGRRWQIESLRLDEAALTLAGRSRSVDRRQDPNPRPARPAPR